ncbi:MAG: SRPBCC domain-containing protein [Elusimicrobiales bacterium]|nr:SRPBCC domain-containing protein [Elusimicrobiales bacterium]
MQKTIETQIVINAGKEKVWAILTDFDNYKNWNPFIINSSGQAIAGGKLINTMKNGNSRFIFKPTVLNVEKLKYLDWLGSLFVKGIFDGHHYFKIEELNPGQVRFTQGENFAGILSGVILRFTGSETRNGFIRMNQALKQLAESTATSQSCV